MAGFQTGRLATPMMGLWALCLSMGALASEPDDATSDDYIDAMVAYYSLEFEQSVALVRQVVAQEPDREDAALLLGLATYWSGEREEGLSIIKPLRSSGDDGIRRKARRFVGARDRVEHRDNWWLALGALLREDRDTNNLRWVSGLGLEVQAPLKLGFGLRLDAVTPWATYGDLAVTGMQTSVLATYQLHIHGGAFVDLAVGPSVWIGNSWAVNGPRPGVFPGLRVALALDVRLVRELGLRLEGGWAGHWSAYSSLQGSSSGPDFRLLGVVHFP